MKCFYGPWLETQACSLPQGAAVLSGATLLSAGGPLGAAVHLGWELFLELHNGTYTTHAQVRDWLLSQQEGALEWPRPGEEACVPWKS